jgi:hypothetical protein
LLLCERTQLKKVKKGNNNKNAKRVKEGKYLQTCFTRHLSLSLSLTPISEERTSLEVNENIGAAIRWANN